jgi:hypothetical protein
VEDEESEHTEEAIVEDEDDGELDSLDTHLLEFRAESAYLASSNEHVDTSTNPVLPTHDGLGSFRLDRTVMGEGVQEQLYAFERYNPRRIKRRKESLELAQLELERDAGGDDERTRRIEEWRLEQSRALLDELQRETRRRRQSISTGRASSVRDYRAEEIATLGSVSDTGTQAREETEQKDESESFWTRITRRVIQDLMGIDDRLLSIIFGEALPEEFQLEATAARPSAEEISALTRDVKNDSSWEYRLLDRIARELGLLVNQLSDHPGAFSTYLKVQQAPLPYAGLPIIPEAVVDTTEEVQTPMDSSSSPFFQPTIPASPKPIDIGGPSIRPGGDDTDSTPPSTFPVRGYQESDDAQIGFTKEEWEKQLDIGLVFSYLRSRFTSRKTPTAAFTHKASTQQDAAARAARVRQHHPLVTRPKVTERRASYRVVVPASPIQQRRRSSSCASQSTKKSALRTSGSSRHYWDINGSVGSGSLIVSTGAMGAWGEV